MKRLNQWRQQTDTDSLRAIIVDKHACTEMHYSGGVLLGKTEEKVDANEGLQEDEEEDLPLCP